MRTGLVGGRSSARRTTRVGRPCSVVHVLVGVVVLLGAWLVVGVAVSVAYTNSVYYDGNSNISIDPDAFGGKAGSYNYNSELGEQGLQNLTSGSDNVASGYGALYYDTAGSENVASGYTALDANTVGIRNVATGWQALYSNTEGSGNVA